MRRILVTGGAGFVGTHLCGRLMDGGTEVIVADYCARMGGGVALDLTSRDVVSRALRDGALGQKVDAIVHLSSRLIGSDNPKDTSVLHDNISMTENVAYLADMLSTRRIIHASTMAVYPNKTGTYNEESLTVTSGNAECMYGLSKVCSEQLLDFLMLQQPVQTVHLRFAQIYGEGMRSDRVMSHMEQELKDTNSITVYGDGVRVSNFIPVDKAVDAICNFITSDAEGIYNVGYEQLSYMDLAERIIKAKGNADSSISTVPQGCREQVVLDCAKYHALLEGGKDTI
jgi:nucleoside-diphosphate-sugar epimerase